MRNVLLSVTVALVVGCGPAALPVPTVKLVTMSDLVGTWKYPADFGKTEVTLELKADGSFLQTVRRGGAADEVHQGNWRLDINRPVLKVLKPQFGDAKGAWIIDDAQWWIVESGRPGIPFAIYGAAEDSDPDSAFEFEKLL